MVHASAMGHRLILNSHVKVTLEKVLDDGLHTIMTEVVISMGSARAIQKVESITKRRDPATRAGSGEAYTPRPPPSLRADAEK